MGQCARQKPEHLSAKLFAIRKHLGLSQFQLARMLGLEVSRGRISEYEHGTREPNLLVLLRYSEIAGVSMETIINDRIGLVRFGGMLTTRDGNRP